MTLRLLKSLFATLLVLIVITAYWWGMMNYPLFSIVTIVGTSLFLFFYYIEPWKQFNTD